MRSAARKICLIIHRRLLLCDHNCTPPINLLDKYSLLVDGKAASEVKEFLESDHSFDEYTLVNLNIIAFFCFFASYECR